MELAYALDEIRRHQKVARYKIRRKKEIEISFTDTYDNLIIPFSEHLSDRQVLTIFNNYLRLYSRHLYLA
jgi:hypothetical protein